MAVELIKVKEDIPEDWAAWASEHYGTSPGDMKWWDAWWNLGGCLFIKRDGPNITGAALWGETPGNFWAYDPKKATEYDTRTVILGMEGDMHIADLLPFTGAENMLVFTDKDEPDYRDNYKFAGPAFWGRHCISEHLTCKKCAERTLASSGRAVAICGCTMRGYIFE